MKSPGGDQRGTPAYPAFAMEFAISLQKLDLGRPVLRPAASTARVAQAARSLSSRSISVNARSVSTM